MQRHPYDASEIAESVALRSISLENASSAQISAIVSKLQLTTLPLRFFTLNSINHHIAQLQSDDALIARDGVDSLDGELLRECTIERGIRANDDDAALRKQLSEWLKVSHTDVFRSFVIHAASRDAALTFKTNEVNTPS